MSGMPENYKKWIWAGGALAGLVVLFAGCAWAYFRQPGASVPPASSTQPGQSEAAAPSEESLPEIETDPVTEDTVSLLLCGLDDAAGLTDVILYASFDVKSGEVHVLQIPRDTYIGDAYKTGKINQVYFAHKRDEEPVRGLIDVVKNQMMLPVDHYVVITLEAFRDLVNAIGGVEVEVPQRIEFLPGKVIEPGRQHLDGERAEWFVRYRAGYKEGDIGRVNAQKLMIDSLVRAVKEQGRSRMLRIASRYFDDVDTDLPLSKALSYANAAFMLEPENLHLYTAEGRGVLYNGFAVYELYKQKLINLLNEHFRPYQDPIYYVPIAQIPPPPSAAPSSEPESMPAESSPEDDWEEAPSFPEEEEQQLEQEPKGFLSGWESLFGSKPQA